MDDFRLRIQIDAIQLLHVLLDGDSEFHAAVVGVEAVFNLSCFNSQCRNDFRKRHVIRFADTHVDQFHIGMRGLRGAFGAFDLLKLVDGRVFAEFVSADAFSEQFL